MPKYDVVLSFAGQDRQHAKDLVDLLERGGYSFFYDENERAHLWGKDLYVHLSSVYKDQGRYCVMFLSEHYA
ncbi:MAG: TIR domain-containing protein, partial [Candidatus Poribacteria bacterium]|nr:TIR domain-containing protein [Candidatus Poribacteria bacterium]